MSQTPCLDTSASHVTSADNALEMTPPPNRSAADTMTDVSVAEACPRCGARLLNPGDLGWCSNCGYCRSLEGEAKLFQTGPAKKASPLGIAEFIDLAREAPSWVWILLGGATFLVILSVAADLTLPAESNLFRCVWTTAQSVLSLVAILTAQVWAAIQISFTTDMELRPKDFIFSWRVWSLAFGEMPRTRKPVTLFAWAVTALLSALFLVGGLAYYWDIYKPKKVVGTSLREAVGRAARASGAESLEEALKDFANTQDLTKDGDLLKATQPKTDTRGTVQCVVIGYLVEGDHLGGLVLAMEKDGAIRYAGTVKTGYTEEEGKALLMMLTKLEQPQPLIPNLSVPAIWVKPEVFCDIHQSGTGPDGTLVKPNFKALLK